MMGQPGSRIGKLFPNNVSSHYYNVPSHCYNVSSHYYNLSSHCYNVPSHCYNVSSHYYNLSSHCYNVSSHCYKSKNSINQALSKTLAYLMNPSICHRCLIVNYKCGPSTYNTVHKHFEQNILLHFIVLKQAYDHINTVLVNAYININ